MPLPLREYYPIGRAAELLYCTLDDLFHWGECGCIKLCLMLHKVNAYCYFDFSIFEEIIKDFNLPKVEVNDETNLFIELYYIVYDFYENNMEKFINELKGKPYCDVALMLIAGFRCKGIEVDCINDIHDRNWNFELAPNYIPGVKFEHCFKIPVTLEGFFPLNYRFYMYRKWEIISDDKKINYVAISSFDFSSNLYVIDNLEYCVNDLFVLKDDFIKIMNASKNGSELTKVSGYEHFSIHAKENNNNKLFTDVRNSATSIKIAKALIINYLPDLKNNPAKLAGVLEREIKQAGLGDFSVSKDTISRWMKED
ncbi:hypothetical protein B0093_002646 [Salmonella enterica subsp. enterica serovar Carrau]|nr:hypothetical protein [Salmonella enterica subsp. enterica serovar Carrau]EDX3496853.1 hypothetical protein [Salmonella enterica subsp. enterica serovar Carrau]ELC5002955.1 hypothetical protein [Salmonella enterica]